MPTLLALDVGTKRTGVAVAFDGTEMAVGKDTIEHRNEKELLTSVVALVAQTHATLLVLGLPYLPSGAEGSQAKIVRSFMESFKREMPGVTVITLDERYTTPRNAQYDGNTAAACDLLSTYIDKEKGLTKN